MDGLLLGLWALVLLIWGFELFATNYFAKSSRRSALLFGTCAAMLGAVLLLSDKVLIMFGDGRINEMFLAGNLLIIIGVITRFVGRAGEKSS
jgi:hypothetical protein